MTSSGFARVRPRPYVVAASEGAVDAREVRSRDGGNGLTLRQPAPGGSSCTSDHPAISTADLNSDRKGVDVLVDALKLMPGVSCELIVVGGGRELSQLTDRAGGDARIRFLGPLPRKETLEQYGRSDVYAFPTRNDIYGLVMVEAMGSGLATVVSTAPGALGDLAVNGVNCLVVGTHDPEDWAEALTSIIKDHEFRQSLAERGKQTIARRWTMEHSVDAMIAGFRLGALTGAAKKR